MGPVQVLEGTLAAIAFGKLKLQVIARAFKNSGLKLYSRLLNLLTNSIDFSNIGQPQAVFLKES